MTSVMIGERVVPPTLGRIPSVDVPPATAEERGKKWKKKRRKRKRSLPRSASTPSPCPSLPKGAAQKGESLRFVFFPMT